MPELNISCKSRSQGDKEQRPLRKSLYIFYSIHFQLLDFTQMTYDILMFSFKLMSESVPLSLEVKKGLFDLLLVYLIYFLLPNFTFIHI